MQSVMTKERFVERVMGELRARNDARQEEDEPGYNEMEELRRIATAFEREYEYEYNGYRHDMRTKQLVRNAKRRSRGTKRKIKFIKVWYGKGLG